MAEAPKRSKSESEMELTRKALQLGGAGTHLSAQVVRLALEHARATGSHQWRVGGTSARGV